MQRRTYGGAVNHLSVGFESRRSLTFRRHRQKLVILTVTLLYVVGKEREMLSTVNIVMPSYKEKGRATNAVSVVISAATNLRWPLVISSYMQVSMRMPSFIETL